MPKKTNLKQIQKSMQLIMPIRRKRVLKLSMLRKKVMISSRTLWPNLLNSKRNKKKLLIRSENLWKSQQKSNQKLKNQFNSLLLYKHLYLNQFLLQWNQLLQSQNQSNLHQHLLSRLKRLQLQLHQHQHLWLLLLSKLQHPQHQHQCLLLLPRLHLAQHKPHSSQLLKVLQLPHQLSQLQ